MRPFERDFFEISPGAALLYPALYFFDNAGWFSALIPAVAIHETGHVLALRCCGMRIHQLRLEITGLCMECETLFRPRQEAFCAFAGPAAGMLWALLLQWIPGSWADVSARISLGLSFFNMLPVRPLDGGRILLAITGSEKLVSICGIITPFVWFVFALWLQQWQGLIPAGLLLLCHFKS